MTTIAFVNSDGNAQVVTEDPCPTCGYPERHQLYAADLPGLIADGCPSCETSRIPVAGHTNGESQTSEYITRSTPAKNGSFRS